MKNLTIVPDETTRSSSAEKSITVLLSSLGSVGQSVAEIRNQFGTGHGKIAEYVGLQKRHARLVIGAIVTVANFLCDSHLVTANPSETSN